VSISILKNQITRKPIKSSPSKEIPKAASLETLLIKKVRDESRTERLHREYAAFFLLKPREISR
jgi:hypothetical protein